MIPPRRALVLAAGFGSRLAPLTLDLPKPLFPCRGEILIGRLLRQLASWGVQEVCVNIHHLADRMVESLPSLCPRGLRLTLSFEPTILGTGGPLRRNRGFFGDDPFWIANADVRMELDPAPLRDHFYRHAPLACLWMLADCGPRTVRVEHDQVVDFRGGGMTFSGLHLVSPRIWRYVPEEEGFASIIDFYTDAMRKGERIAAVEIPGSQWADLGTPEQLLAANGDSVVLPGARVERGAILDHAMVGENARVRRGRRVSGMVCSPQRGLTPLEQRWLPEAEAVEFLPARGSDRSFRRVHLARGTRMLMTFGDARPENLRFVGHTRFLRRHRLPAPRVLRVSPDGHTLLLEDLGRIHLIDRLREGSPARNARDMQKVLAVTARLHALPLSIVPPTEPAFSPALFAWEHDLFVREFLRRYDPATDPEELLPDLRRAARHLVRQSRVLVHRDLQSTNFLMTPRGPALIDYQGMRPGPAAYDLASLLADPYIGRPVDEQLRWLHHYNTLVERPVTEHTYRLAALQRLAQALGAFGRLGASPATARFRAHIPAALRQIRDLSPFPSLTKWAESHLMRSPPHSTEPNL